MIWIEMLFVVLMNYEVNEYEYFGKVEGTMYNAVIEQCEGNPLQTASGDWICLDSLKSADKRWIAISRDMHKRYGGEFEFGQVVTIESKYEYLNGEWIIKDLMNERFTKRIDFLQCKETGFYGKWDNLKLYKAWKTTIAKKISKILCLHSMQQD